MIFLDLNYGRHYYFPLEYEFWQHQLDVRLYQHLKHHLMKEIQTLVEQLLEHLDFELEVQSYLEFVISDHLVDLRFLVAFVVDPVEDTFDFGLVALSLAVLPLAILPLVALPLGVQAFAVVPFVVPLDPVVVVLVPNLDIMEHLLV